MLHTQYSADQNAVDSADQDAMRSHLEFLFSRPEIEALNGLIEINTEDGMRNLNWWRRFRSIEIDKAVAYAAAMTQQGRRVYVGAGLRRGDMTQSERSFNGDILAWPALVWDFDSLEDAKFGLGRAREIGLPFHLVVQTGALRNGGEPDLRIQCWTLLASPVSDMAEVTRLLKAGVEILHSDNIHDPRRIMRLAGSVAWARKDGRIDEPTRILHSLMDAAAAPLSADAIAELFRSCDPTCLPAPQIAPKSVSPERMAEVSRQIANGGLGIWRDSPTVREHLTNLQVGQPLNDSLWNLALKAAQDCRGEGEILEALIERMAVSDARQGRPERWKEEMAKLPDTVKRAVKDAGMATQMPYRPAEEDFPPILPGQFDHLIDPREAMFARFAWCERLCCAVDLATGDTLNQVQFDTRNYRLGNIGSRSQSPWIIFRLHGDRRLNVDSLTFRPGGERLVDEPGIGRCVNTWLPDPNPLTETPTDEDVRPFLDHAAFVIPDAREREIVLNWMAAVAQRQGEKPNWAIVLGSTVEGVGKDLLLNPLRRAIGRSYVREIDASELISGFTGFKAKCKLLIVQEMENFERRRTANLLKNLLASPPEYLRVNEKHEKPYDTPNIMACVFMSNEFDAIQIGAGDRRYFVAWSSQLPKPADYYQSLVAWGKAGGWDKAAAWLLARDVSTFDMFGRAPDSPAKTNMRKASRSLLQEWIEDGIEERTAPFQSDLICLQEVYRQLPPEIFGRGGHLKPSMQKLCDALIKAGAQRCGRMRLGRRPPFTEGQQVRLMSIRRHEMFAGESNEKLRELFWILRDRLELGPDPLDLAA